MALAVAHRPVYTGASYFLFVQQENNVTLHFNKINVISPDYVCCRHNTGHRQHDKSSLFEVKHYGLILVHFEHVQVTLAEAASKR